MTRVEQIQKARQEMEDRFGSSLEPRLQGIVEAVVADLLETETERVLSCVGRWLDLKNGSRREPTGSADLHHSALLQRLLAGKDPLPLPPPRRFSYPDYSLAEGTEVRPEEIACYREGTAEPISPSDAQSGDSVVIDQNSWRVEGREEGALILVWPETGERYRAREQDGSWRLLLHRPEFPGGDRLHWITVRTWRKAGTRSVSSSMPVPGRASGLQAIRRAIVSATGSIPMPCLSPSAPVRTRAR